MQPKLKTKLWISLILLTLAIGGGLASYIGSEDTLFKGLILPTTTAPTIQQLAEIGSAPSTPPVDIDAGDTGLPAENTNLGSGSATQHISAQNPADQTARVGTDDLTRTSTSTSGTRSISTQYPADQAARVRTLDNLETRDYCADFTNESECAANNCEWLPAIRNMRINDECRPIQTAPGAGEPADALPANTVTISPDPAFANSELSPGETGTVASFIFENQSQNEARITSVKFEKTALWNRSLANSEIGNIRLIKGTQIIGDPAEIRTDNTIQWPNESAITDSLFSIGARSTVKISLRATIAENAEPNKKIRFGIMDGTYVATSSSVIIIPNTNWPVKSAIITIGAATAEEEPEELPTLNVSRATNSPPSANVAINQWFDAAKFSFAASDLVEINSININAKGGLADAALPLDKIDEIKLCIGIPSGPDFCSFESAEHAFNPNGTNVNLIFDSNPWMLGFVLPIGTITIKAKLKNDAESEKRFALGINSANSVTLATPGSADISGSFPIWGNEMTVAAIAAPPPPPAPGDGGSAVTPRACRNGQYNNGGPDGGVCVCRAGTREYVGGASGTAYSPSICIPCTSEELVSTGGYYCPADLPAHVTLPAQVFCNELQVSPASFFPFVARQTFTSIVNPTSFTGVVVWRHWKGDGVIESTNGREATFNNINTESIITVDALPASGAASNACHKQIEPGENLASGAPQGSGAENWTGGEGALNGENGVRGEEVHGSAEQPEGQPLQGSEAGMGALDLSETQRLRRAPERSGTGPEILVYFGILAAIQGGIILKRKLGKKS